MLKKLLTVLFGLALSVSLLAQQIPYGHEWINFDNGQPTLKVKVLQDGIYRISYADLEAALSNTSTPVAQVNPQHTTIFNKGKQIPIYIQGEQDGSFDSGDFIEFYGERNDGWFDQFLYEKPRHRTNKYYSNFSDTAIYFLTFRPNPAFTKKRLKQTTNDVSNPGPKRQFFTKTKVFEYHGNWNGGHASFVGGAYLYSAKYTDGEGFLSGDFNKNTLIRTLGLDGIFKNGPITKATIRTNLVSYFEQNHRIRFSVNNNVLMDTSFVGQGVKPFTNQINISNLNANSGNEFKYEALGTGSSDRNAIGFIEVTYPGDFDFNGNSFYDFKIIGPKGQNAYFEIQNFELQGQAPILHDMKNQTRLEGVISGGNLKFKIPFPHADTAQLYLSSVSSIKSPVAVTVASFQDLGELSDQGDYMLVYHPSLEDDGSGNNWIEEYRKYRESMAGGNHDVVKISINTIYDQFGYGIDQHPQAVCNFAQFMLDSFQVLPESIFLVGKGVEYIDARTDQGKRSINLMPTFGHPGGDISFSMNREGIPMIAIGRLSARNGFEVFKYLEKVKALEANQNNISSYSIKQKNWTKNVLHFGGGGDKGQQDLFRQFLNNYAKKVENPLYGGRVSSIFKTSPDPIQYVQSQFLDSIISSGISLITFFGHSSANSFDINLDKPENYDNFGKTPIIVSNGCFSGQIFSTGRGVSEQFVLERKGGSIGFLASTSYGEQWSLNSYSTKLYENLSQYRYNESFANSIKHTVRYILDSTSPSIFLRYLTRINTFHGDPAIKINTHEKPDYAIEPQYVHFEPENLSVDQDSFSVVVVIHNLGKAIKGKYTVEVRRTFADGSFALQSKEVEAAYADDTLRLKFYTDPIRGVNRNDFEIFIDSDDAIDEIRENNNKTNVSIEIKSQEAFPVYPYEFGISSGNITLKANTSDLSATSQRYVMEIDTSALFNSPVKRQSNITGIGGVLEWANPNITFTDETVYYWRISPAFSDPDSTNWHSSSFLYKADDVSGWNQSHYYQFRENELENLNFSKRNLQYIDDFKELRVTNGIYSNVSWEDVTAYYINNARINRWSCIGKGIVIAVIDNRTGLPWKIEDHEYGEVVCQFSSQRGAFHFYTSNVNWRKRAIDLLDSIPDGHYIIAMNFQRPEYSEWKADSSTLGTTLMDKLGELGAQGLYHLDTLKYNASFIFFTQKGKLGSSHTLITQTEPELLDTTFVISGKWNEGFVSSPVIGPAKSYNKLEWSPAADNDPFETDETTVTLYGIGENLVTQSSLFTTKSMDSSISPIDPSIYPNVRMRYTTTDDTFRTATNLDKWRIIYEPVGDVSVNPLRLFEISADTISQGETFEFKVAIENITDYDMDSLLVALSHVNSNNEKSLVWEKRFKPMAGSDTLIISYKRDTRNDVGRNTLILEANPDDDQPEQNRFNNTLSLPYVAMEDNQNPLLDVTFDGVHIMDGDIVSAKPMIHVVLNDENRFLPLNDTSLINMFINYPDGSRKRVAFSNKAVTFIPAEKDNGNGIGKNEAEIRYDATFQQDGEHELVVSASDKSGNRSGKLDYRISFEVINETMISNVFNYPNPFTSSTQFVFTLTGSELPENLRIQIMTVTGRVVREITKDELGPLHIGTNRTEFWWDGTDQFGDPLANGLYLYRVISSDSEGSNLKNYKLEGNADRFFENGIGKMYLAR